VTTTPSTIYYYYYYYHHHHHHYYYYHHHHYFTSKIDLYVSHRNLSQGRRTSLSVLSLSPSGVMVDNMMLSGSTS